MNKNFIKPVFAIGTTLIASVATYGIGRQQNFNAYIIAQLQHERDLLTIQSNERIQIRELDIKEKYLSQSSAKINNNLSDISDSNSPHSIFEDFDILSFFDTFSQEELIGIAILSNTSLILWSIIWIIIDSWTYKKSIDWNQKYNNKFMLKLLQTISYLSIGNTYFNIGFLFIGIGGLIGLGLLILFNS